MRSCWLFLALLLVVLAYVIVSTPSGSALVDYLSLANSCVQGAHKSCNASFVTASVTGALDELRSPYTPTAERIAADFGTSLEGKVAIVTGASSGIGLESTRILLSRGCHVVLAVRSKAKGEEKLASLRQHAAGTTTVLELDTSDLDSVKAFASQFLKLGLPLHFLVNNAGIMATPFAVSKQGWESQFATNCIGHFLLTRLLEPVLLSSGSMDEPSRVIFVSSMAHQNFFNTGEGTVGERMQDLIPPTRPYEPLLNYAWTKTLNILHATAFQKRWGSSGNAVAVALHPGIIKTSLLSHTRQSDVPQYEALFYGPLFIFAHKSVGQGASTTLFTMLSPEVIANSRSGKIYYFNNALAVPSPSVTEAGAADEAFRRSEELISKWL
eukprot:TRINITY_DN34065_c0_g1_i1.p1 TRINITY_DN34065_c0_g1~~TRINITY_DN34065_c0_g1_i1.p1  ORF type:complete len:397 (+),score=47.52 TRINITY_DN34065_c0_g1_i1:43-1191(+)